MTQIPKLECDSVLAALDQLITHPDWMHWPQFEKLRSLKGELEGLTNTNEPATTILARIDATVQSISEELQASLSQMIPDLSNLDSPYEKPVLTDETQS